MRKLLLLLAAAVGAGCASIPRGTAAINGVRIEGNEAVSGSDIQARLATAPSPKFLYLFQGFIHDPVLFDRSVLQRDLERVERYYRARGHYEAHARAGRVRYSGEQHVDITIEVEEGPAVVVRGMRVDGLAGLPPKVVGAVRKALRGSLEAGRPFEEARFQEAENAMRRALTDRGHAWAAVERRADVDLPGHFANLFFVVRPGPRATFGRVQLVGLGDLPEAPVLRALDIAPGDPYSTADIAAAEQAVVDLGTFSSVEIIPDLGTGPPSDVRQSLPSDVRQSLPSDVRQSLPSDVRQSLPSDVRQSLLRDAAVPLKVVVRRQKLRSLLAGGGLELDAVRTNAHLRVGWEHRNLFGGFRHFTLDFRPGVDLYPTRLPDFEEPTQLLVAERFRAELRQPGFLEARTNAVIAQELNIYPVLLASKVDPEAPVVGYVEYRGSVGLDRTLWKLFVASSYNLQWNSPFTYRGELDSDLRRVVVSYVDLLAHFDFRDDRLRPHKGVYLQNDVQFAGLGGDARDVRLQPEVRGYVPLGDKVTLAARSTVGFLFPMSYAQGSGKRSRAEEILDIELVYLRGFFSGGPSSNRGYPLRGVGPRGSVPFFNPGLEAKALEASCNRDSPKYDEARCAVPLGGLSLWEASLELRFPLFDAFSGTLFCDAGDVSPRRLDLRLDRPHLSCGVGLRYDTPIGPLRLDVGYRIPGLQAPPGSELGPAGIFGVPIALAVGLGEAF